MELLILYAFLMTGYIIAFAVMPIIESRAEKKRAKIWKDYFKNIENGTTNN